MKDIKRGKEKEEGKAEREGVSVQIGCVLRTLALSQVVYNLALGCISACTEPRHWPEAKDLLRSFLSMCPVPALKVAFKFPQ